jgi:hypothetical protein
VINSKISWSKRSKNAESSFPVDLEPRFKLNSEAMQHVPEYLESLIRQTKIESAEILRCVDFDSSTSLKNAHTDSHIIPIRS